MPGAINPYTSALNCGRPEASGLVRPNARIPPVEVPAIKSKSARIWSTQQMKKTAMMFGLSLLAAPLWASAATAGPLGSPIVPLASEALATPVLSVQRCWKRNGSVYCRWSDGVVRLYLWNDPNRYPTGSTAWWRAMDFAGRGGIRR